MRGRLHISRRTGGLLALVVLTAVLAVTLTAVALLFAPALLLAAALIAGYTPGARLLDRMRARRFPPRAARAPRALTVRRVVVVRRMTRIAASALAMRPPPAAPALIS